MEHISGPIFTQLLYVSMSRYTIFVKTSSKCIFALFQRPIQEGEKKKKAKVKEYTFLGQAVSIRKCFGFA